MSGVGDQGLRPEHVQPQPPDDEQLAAEEEAEQDDRPRRLDEPPIEPAGPNATDPDQERRDPDSDRRSQRNP